MVWGCTLWLCLLCLLQVNEWLASLVDAGSLLSLKRVGWGFIAKQSVLLDYLPGVLVVDQGPALPTRVESGSSGLLRHGGFSA